MNLPYAAEADIEISMAELEVLEDAYKRAHVSSRGHVPNQVKFNYAWGLVRSKYREDQENGVILLQEIYREDPERQRECMYYLALGYYRLGEFTQSRKFNEMLLKSEPDNKQALSLRASIDKKLRRDGLLGAAVVGAAVTTIGVVLGALFAARRR